MNAVTVIGGLIFLLGIVLLIGNVTGAWRTFPYAGFITMTIGGVVARLAED